MSATRLRRDAFASAIWPANQSSDRGWAEGSTEANIRNKLMAAKGSSVLQKVDQRLCGKTPHFAVGDVNGRQFGMGDLCKLDIIKTDD